MTPADVADVFSIDTIKGVQEPATKTNIQTVDQQTRTGIVAAFQLKNGEVCINGIQQPRGYPIIDISGETSEGPVWIR